MACRVQAQEDVEWSVETKLGYITICILYDNYKCILNLYQTIKCPFEDILCM